MDKALERTSVAASGSKSIESPPEYHNLDKIENSFTSTEDSKGAQPMNETELNNQKFERAANDGCGSNRMIPNRINAKCSSAKVSSNDCRQDSNGMQTNTTEYNGIENGKEKAGLLGRPKKSLKDIFLLRVLAIGGYTLVLIVGIVIRIYVPPEPLEQQLVFNSTEPLHV